MKWRFGFSLLGQVGFSTLLALHPATGRAEPSRDPSHIVGKGETIGGVARHYNVSIEALRAANGLSRGQAIRAGQTLALPAPGAGTEEEKDDRAAATAPRGPAASSWSRKGVRPGVVRLVRGSETLQTRVLDRRRHLVANTLPEFTRFLRFPSGATHPIDPRLVTLLAMVSDHFGGREVMVVSGFRPYSTRQFTPHSNHNIGRALDFAIQGVQNETLRDFCRTFHNVGVGYYPNSSFVHLDVRDANATWTDFAGPGQAPRYHHPEDRLAADEGAGEVEGVATVDRPGGSTTGSDETPSVGLVRPGKDLGNSSTRDSTGEHSVYPGRQ